MYLDINILDQIPLKLLGVNYPLLLKIKVLKTLDNALLWKQPPLCEGHKQEIVETDPIFGQFVILIENLVQLYFVKVD